MNHLQHFHQSLNRNASFLVITSALMLVLSVAYSIAYSESLSLYFQIGAIILTALLIGLALYLKMYPSKNLKNFLAKPHEQISKQKAYRTLQLEVNKISYWRKVLFFFGIGIFCLISVDSGFKSVLFFLLLAALESVFIALLYQIEKSATKNLTFLRLEQRYS